MISLMLLLQVAFALAVLAAVLVIVTNWPSRLDLGIALRYLKSRRSSRLLSLIPVIALGGVTVGVTGLVLVLGVMDGLQADLRDKILVASPHLRVLTYGSGLRLDHWGDVLAAVAGIMHSSPVLETTDEDLDRVLNVNFKGVLYACQEAARAMLAQRTGIRRQPERLLRQ